MLFSILIPSYNSETHIDECIRSVLEQSEQDYEIIVVNDGSTDKSGKILEKYSQRDNRIKVINQENKGLFQTRYIALEVARGKYIVFLDSDDTLKHNALTRLKDVFFNEQLDMIIYKFDLIYDSGKRIISKPVFEHDKLFDNESKKELLYKKLMLGSSINSMCIKAIRREYFTMREKNIDVNITMSEDLVHTLDPITNAKKIKYINESLYNYRIHSNSMTKKFDSNTYNSLRIVHKILFQYLNDWDLNTEYYRELIYQRFLKSMASMLLFSRSKITEKKEEYLNTVKEVRKDKMFNEALKYKNNLPLIYKFALYLIEKNRIYILIVLKKIIGNVRK